VVKISGENREPMLHTHVDRLNFQMVAVLDTTGEVWPIISGKVLFGSERAQDSWFHLQVAVASLEQEFPVDDLTDGPALITCGCGVAGCGGFDLIAITWHGESVRWTSYSTYGSVPD
jgi:hypothetical protein